MRRLLPILAVVLAACQSPPVERFLPSGNAPPPTGVLEGTVLYRGPRPLCTRDKNGTPTGLPGRVVLLLFSWKHLPAPFGDATTAANLLTVPGDALFTDLKNECMPAKPTPAQQAVIITRTVPFTWPQITLGDDYQIRAFYDLTGDFSPFYSVTNQPTLGDLLGGAFQDPTSPNPVYAHVAFGTAAAYPKGERITGVTVTLAAPASTERPVFSLDPGTTGLDATATLPADPNPVTAEVALWDLTNTRLDIAPPANPAWKKALTAAKLDFDLDSSHEAWFVRPLDLNGDGKPDLHPILGAQGVEWDTPMVIFQRARTQAEITAGIPVVRLIGSVRPTQTLTKRVFYPSIDILVPPVALVTLDPTNPACTIPYLPPGNLAPLYEGKPVECQELPSGHYDIDVFEGLAGATQVSGVDAATSDTGYDYTGGFFDAQAWTIPNELGPPDTRYHPNAVDQIPASAELDSQGPDGRFPVFDSTPKNGVRHDCAQAPDPTQGGTPRPVNYTPVPAACCAAVKHLCGIPLCDAKDDGQGHMVREDMAVYEGKPSCVPFLPPASCCPSKP